MRQAHLVAWALWLLALYRPVGDTDIMYSGSRPTSGEQVDTFFSYPSDLLPPYSYDDSTVASPSVTYNSPQYPFQEFQFPGITKAEDLADTFDSDLTLPAPLSQDSGQSALPAPEACQDHNTIAPSDNNDTTSDYYLRPGEPQPDLSAGTCSSQITAPATATPEKPYKCPVQVCPLEFPRWQDRDRHLSIHLPHWIHCPLLDCTWRGNRVKTFEQHWLKCHKSCGRIPKREDFEIFNPKEFTNEINAGTISVGAVADCAIIHVLTKADQLQKRSMLENPWGYKLKQASDSEYMCMYWRRSHSRRVASGDFKFEAGQTYMIVLHLSPRLRLVVFIMPYVTLTPSYRTTFPRPKACTTHVRYIIY
ncbi:hypothetical protein EI94DRAFT_1698315 [Lactarius quietus]|nr:hypothetical protein EI94DRAFT_1698315 [Lactarius quietus]